MWIAYRSPCRRNGAKNQGRKSMSLIRKNASPPRSQRSALAFAAAPASSQGVLKANRLSAALAAELAAAAVEACVKLDQEVTVVVLDISGVHPGDDPRRRSGHPHHRYRSPQGLHGNDLQDRYDRPGCACPRKARCRRLSTRCRTCCSPRVACWCVPATRSSPRLASAARAAATWIRNARGPGSNGSGTGCADGRSSARRTELSALRTLKCRKRGA